MPLIGPSEMMADECLAFGDVIWIARGEVKCHLRLQKSRPPDLLAIRHLAMRMRGVQPLPLEIERPILRRKTLGKHTVTSIVTVHLKIVDE